MEEEAFIRWPTSWNIKIELSWTEKFLEIHDIIWVQQIKFRKENPGQNVFFFQFQNTFWKLFFPNYDLRFEMIFCVLKLQQNVQRLFFILPVISQSICFRLDQMSFLRLL